MSELQLDSLESRLSRLDLCDDSLTSVVRRCAWCGEAIGHDSRRDRKTCSQKCRQALSRFRSGCTQAVTSSSPLRLAYADPPYPGKAGYYRDHPDYAGEVDHAALIRRLSTFDGWALSTSARALPEVLSLCPPGVRVAAWLRGERPCASYDVLNAWEPVIFVPGRLVMSSPDLRRVDALQLVSRPRLSDPRRVIGAKPAKFAYWVFELLGASDIDSFDDLFPGSGGVGRAWSVFASQSDNTPSPLLARGSGSGSGSAAGEGCTSCSLGDSRGAGTGAAIRSAVASSATIGTAPVGTRGGVL